MMTVANIMLMAAVIITIGSNVLTSRFHIHMLNFFAFSYTGEVLPILPLLGHTARPSCILLLRGLHYTLYGVHETYVRGYESVDTWRRRRCLASVLLITSVVANDTNDIE